MQLIFWINKLLQRIVDLGSILKAKVVENVQ